MAYFMYCLGHNVFIAHSIFKSLLWAVPLLGATGFRRNIVTNAKVIIDSIYLLEDGTKVEIKNVNGDRKSYAVRNIRRPN